jgi:hypothetical protein
MDLEQQRSIEGLAHADERGIAASRWHIIVLALLACQFVLAQVVTQPLFGDAPRNLHWGLLTAENPAFLLGAPDAYERNKGFAPDPPTLAARDLWRSPPSSLHRWWGPLAPLLFGMVWALTRSYVLLQLVIPLAGAGTVLLTYALARAMLGRKQALLAAAFLACFPLFREYSSTSYTEALSALVLTGALAAYWRGRPLLTMLGGALCGLTKLDLLLLYFGTVGVCALYVALRQRRAAHAEPGQDRRFRQLRYQALAIAGPALLVAPWMWTHYLAGGAGGPTRGLSGSLFVLIFPQMVELLFYIPWYGAIITIAAIVAAVAAGLRSQQLAGTAALLMCTWLGLGLLVMLVYAATPGAGNSPRVILPALPALAILFAGGFGALSAVWRRRIGFYLVVLFALINVVTLVYDARAGQLSAYAPVWNELRARPRGFVLTEAYWETILFTRQPATWFEFDETFQHNIMENSANFARYVQQNPIRYVILPAASGLASDDVRAFLDRHAKRADFGAFALYTLP